MKKYILSIFLAGLSLMGYAQTPGEANSSYLDIAKYATIDEAGWNHNLVDNLYKYTEDQNNECAWLTLPCYGAVVGAKYSTTSSTFGKENPQKWMGTGVSNTNQCGSKTWSANDVYLGSSSYFTSTTAKAVGTNSKNSTSNKTVTFYVTNTTAVKLYGYHNGSITYPTSLTVYECTVNGNTLTTEGGSKYIDETNNGKVVNFSIDLEASKIYKVVASQARGYLYEIAFKTPLSPKLSATSTDLTFEYDPGQSVQNSFTVKGSNLKGAVSMTLNDPEGVFSLSPNSITVNNKTVDQEVTVTFNPGTANRVFEGSVTLSSQGVDDVVINLKSMPNKFPVTINRYGVGTLYLDFPVEIPYDAYSDDLLGVFFAYEATGKELKMARIRQIIPANEGVVIEGNAREYVFPRYKGTDIPALPRENILSGSVKNVAVSEVLEGQTGSLMTLGLGSNGYVGFYSFSGATLQANKAFLIYNSNSNANSLSISGMNGDYTGIREVNANKNDGAWYTLQGVRLNGAPKQAGLYIRNGKTMVVK